MSHPETLDQLANHPIEEHEIVLLVRRPSLNEKRNGQDRGNKYMPKTYNNRVEANDAYKQNGGR